MGQSTPTSGWMIVARYSIVRALLVAKDTTAFSVDTMHGTCSTFHRLIVSIEGMLQVSRVHTIRRVYPQA